MLQPSRTSVPQHGRYVYHGLPLPGATATCSSRCSQGDNVTLCNCTPPLGRPIKHLSKPARFPADAARLAVLLHSIMLIFTQGWRWWSVTHGSHKGLLARSCTLSQGASQKATPPPLKTIKQEAGMTAPPPPALSYLYRRTRKETGKTRQEEDSQPFHGGLPPPSFGVMENMPVVIGRYRLSKTLGIGAFGKVKCELEAFPFFPAATDRKNENKLLLLLLDLGQQQQRREPSSRLALSHATFKRVWGHGDCRF